MNFLYSFVVKLTRFISLPRMILMEELTTLSSSQLRLQISPDMHLVQLPLQMVPAPICLTSFSFSVYSVILVLLHTLDKLPSASLVKFLRSLTCICEVDQCCHWPVVTIIHYVLTVHGMLQANFTRWRQGQTRGDGIRWRTGYTKSSIPSKLRQKYKGCLRCWFSCWLVRFRELRLARSTVNTEEDMECIDSSFFLFCFENCGLRIKYFSLYVYLFSLCTLIFVLPRIHNKCLRFSTKLQSKTLIID